MTAHVAREPKDELDTRPVLVTGMHRSGTTWVGHMLCAGDDFIRLGEPLSPVNRQTILKRKVERWYTYIDERNEAPYLRAYEDAMRFRAHPIDDLRRARLGSPRDPGRLVGRWTSFALGRLQGRRVLFHDPFAILSAEWFARRVGCQIVVLVRHPLSVVSGLKRLGWSFDFRNLSEQPALMSGLLAPYGAEIQEAVHSNDIVEQGCLLWRIVYETVRRNLTSHPSISILRHEDLSSDPEGGFRRLYELLSAEYTAKAQATIQRSTNSTNPTELSTSNPDGRRLDSRANLGNWRHRLDDDEVARIVGSTHSAASAFYSEEDVREILARGAPRKG